MPPFKTTRFRWRDQSVGVSRIKLVLLDSWDYYRFVSSPPSRWKRIAIWLGLLMLANLFFYIFFERHFVDEYFWSRVVDFLICWPLLALIQEPVRLTGCFAIIHSVLYYQSNPEISIRAVCEVIGYVLFALHFAFFIACKTYKIFLYLLAIIIVVLAVGGAVQHICVHWALQHPSPISFSLAATPGTI